MSRMRAVENRRWLLRDTNTGITTIIDPYGRLTASVPRHALTSLAAKYGYRSDLTFYTRARRRLRLSVWDNQLLPPRWIRHLRAVV